MYKYVKYIIVSILILMSFYITNKTAILVRNEDPILKKIQEVSKEINKDSIDAYINDEYIIPGMYGKLVNELNSLSKMKEDNIFNSLYIYIDDIKPNISLEDNKDKIIKEGNAKKYAVSFIIPNKDSIKKYFIDKGIKASLLVNLDNYNDNIELEVINNDFNNYKTLDKLLTKDNKNTNICLINKDTLDFCKKNKKYLVEYSIYLNKDIINAKKNIKSGSIIYVDDITYLDTLINYIYSKDLKIVYLSELIKEKD